MEGLTIDEAQAALAALGFDCPRSGRLDIASQAALADFQRNMQLPQTGKLDDPTAAAIDRLRHIWQGRTGR